MISREFIYCTDEDFGDLGFMPTWISGANATLNIAHDMLEHTKGGKGLSEIEDELRAVGCYLIGRCQVNYTNTKLHETVQYEVASMCSTNKEQPRFIRTRALTGDEEWMNEEIERGVYKGVLNGLQEADITLSYTETTDLVAAYIAHLRIGVRGALKRYAKVDMYSLFVDIFNMLNKTSNKLHHSGDVYEGDRVRFSVCPKTGHIAVSVNNRYIDI